MAAFSGTLALPSTGSPTNVATLNDTFSVTTAGSYTVTLTDMQFPQALTTLTLAITLQGTLLTDPAFGTTSGNACRDRHPFPAARNLSDLRWRAKRAGP